MVATSLVIADSLLLSLQAEQQKGTHQNGGGDGKSQNEPGKTFDDPK